MVLAFAPKTLLLWINDKNVLTDVQNKKLNSAMLKVHPKIYEIVSSKL